VGYPKNPWGRLIVCLAIPVKLTKVEGDTGWVEMGGARRKVNLLLLPDAKVVKKKKPRNF